jgi:hypothetical protein
MLGFTRRLNPGAGILTTCNSVVIQPVRQEQLLKQYGTLRLNLVNVHPGGMCGIKKRAQTEIGKCEWAGSVETRR